MKTPELPERPPELPELEARRAKFITERKGIVRELERLLADAWEQRQSGDDALDRAAEELASGKIKSASRDAVPERAETLRGRLDLV